MARIPTWLMLLLLVATVGCFPHEAGPQLVHFETQAPQVGDPAPLFSLQDLAGNTVNLSEMVGEKPIVLQFGSHSCPVYRFRRHWIRDIYEDYQDRVSFLIVYTVEAHPVGSKSPYAEEEWDTWWNRLTGVRVDQPADEASRQAQASFSHEKLRLDPLMVVDDMDNTTWKAYGAASSPAFVIDTEGQVVSRQVWIEPKQIRQVLDRLLVSRKTIIQGGT